MEFRDYQSKAHTTDISKRPVVALFGLAGEIGGLFSVYKKLYRDAPDPEQFKAALSEELGDILWYVAAFASQNDLELEKIAEANLKKTSEFFGPSSAPYFDKFYPENERLPQHMLVDFVKNDKDRVQMEYLGKPLGDSLSNNSHVEDNYKFHDAFHLAFLTHLHWSPNMRRLLKRKRKSNAQIDENEDGARACAVEEAAAAIVFDSARNADFFPRLESIPLSLVSLLMKMTSNFEVGQCSSAAWRQAIYDGSRAFEYLSRKSGGKIELDVTSATFIFK